MFVTAARAQNMTRAAERLHLTVSALSHQVRLLEQRLLAFQYHYERSASPFKWTFSRRDLHARLAKIAAKRLALAA